MPLKPGPENIGANIKELEEHGSRPRSHKQIVAIALSEARKTSKPHAFDSGRPPGRPVIPKPKHP